MQVVVRAGPSIRLTETVAKGIGLVGAHNLLASAVPTQVENGEGKQGGRGRVDGGRVLGWDIGTQDEWRLAHHWAREAAFGLPSHAPGDLGPCAGA